MVLFGAKALDQYPRNKGLWGWGDVVASLIVIAQVLTYTRSSNRHCCQVLDLYANSWCYHAFFGANFYEKKCIGANIYAFCMSGQYMTRPHQAGL